MASSSSVRYFVFLLVLWFSVSLGLGCHDEELEGDDANECSDGADNDLDGLFDCDDPGCDGSPDCDGDDDDTTSGDDDDTTPGDDDDTTDDDDDDDTTDDDDDDDTTDDDDDDDTTDDDDDDDTTDDDDDTSPADADGDGYSTADGDCDDNDATVHPGAPELCDGIDNDCNGSIDDSVVYQDWWPDADGDGHGDGTQASINDCTNPGGYAASSDDCDDTDATIYPGAPELCDGLDGDCDGAIPADETDDDGDGYDECAGGDCDDADAAIHPGVTEVCNGLDDDCDGTIPADETDDDGDGYDECGDGDCDDGAAAVYPGATEICDGVDNDCDGSIPADETDDDGDGYDECGDGDCDDAEPTTHPGATEACDGVDNNCDGSIDNGVTYQDYWPDTDGDGYGDGTGAAINDCAPPAGYVESDTDCDDGDASVHPGAAEVACDGIDNDCDGAQHGDEIDDDGDGQTECDGDCDDTDAALDDSDGDGDGISSCAGDCDDGSASTYPGATEICDGADNDCDGAVPADETDDDGDGYDECADADCDDADAGIYPGAAEACDGLDNDCDGSIPADETDDDGDGANECGDGDCDDGDASIYPGATEICDGIDNNCDGSVDNGVSYIDYWPDADGDGYGDDGTPATNDCAPPSGYVDNDGDCDDGDASVHPGATEVACDGVDNDCDGAQHGDDSDDDGDGLSECDGDCDDTDASLDNSDDDGDGMTSCDGDCDDGNASIYPGNPEICDGVDNDCNGDVDEDDANVVGLITYYADADGDSYGDPGSTTDACSTPSGYVSNTSDCDDTNAAIKPGATEVCDGVDNDCDGDVDDDDPGISGQSTWYLDADGDGHGLSGATTVACDQPSGYTSSADDCDDSDAAIYPGNAEICDGMDNDCDGDVDDDDLGITGQTTWYPDADGDGYGSDTTSLDACDQPSGYMSTGGDCDDGDAAAHPGADEYCDGIDNDCDGSTDESSALDAETWYLDNDGDGYGQSGSSLVACDDPGGYSTAGGDCDDSDTGINPGEYDSCGDGIDQDCDGVDDACAITHCGYISSSETWASNSAHEVLCPVVVYNGATLTIEDGANVFFYPYTRISIGTNGSGTIDVQGTGNGVVFTSYQASPAPGDWDGVYFGSSDGGSTLTGLTIEYAGSNGTTSVALTGASPTFDGVTIRESLYHGMYASVGSYPTIANTTIEDNAGSGIYLAPDSGLATGASPTFTNNTITGNTSIPMSMPLAYVKQLDGNNDMAGNGNDRIYVYAGNITEDATWFDHGVPYWINGTIEVQGAASPTWTLEDGVGILFESASRIHVGLNTNGKMIVDGHTEGVELTSAAATPANGDWYGIYTGPFDTGSSFLGMTLDYAGSNSVSWQGALWVDDSAAVEVLDCTISNSGTNGILATLDAQLLIEGTTVSDSDYDGIYMYPNCTLDRTGSPSFADNTITGNGAYAMTLDVDYAGELASSSTFSGNTADWIRLHGGPISETTTWHGVDVPFLIVDDAYVHHTNGPTLTITDGVEVQFAANVGFYVGYGGSGTGTLVVDAPTTDALFTSGQSTPAPGDWSGLYLGSSGAAASLTGLTVSYAGGNGVAGIRIYNTNPTLEGCTVVDSGSSGVSIEGSSMPLIQDSAFLDNDLYGIHVEPTAGLSRTGSPSFTGNTVSGNGYNPVDLPAAYANELDVSSTFAGNYVDSVGVEGDTIEDDATWQDLDAPYFIHGTVLVQGASTPILTIADGTEVQLDSGATLLVGYTQPGGLYLWGLTYGITLTSGQSSPARGDWAGIDLGPYCYYPQTWIVGATVEYGGGNNTGQIWIDGCDATIFNSTVQNSSSYGIYVGSGSPVIYAVTYNNNAWGDIYP